MPQWFHFFASIYSIVHFYDFLFHFYLPETFGQCHMRKENWLGCWCLSVNGDSMTSSSTTTAPTSTASVEATMASNINTTTTEMSMTMDQPLQEQQNDNDGNNNEANDSNNNVGLLALTINNTSSTTATPTPLVAASTPTTTDASATPVTTTSAAEAASSMTTLMVPRPPALPPRPPNLVLPHAGAVPRQPQLPYTIMQQGKSKRKKKLFFSICRRRRTPICMVVWKWTETSCTHIVLKDLAFDHIFSFEVNFTYKKNFPQKLLLFLSMYLGSSYKYMFLSMKVFCCWKFYYYLHQDTCDFTVQSAYTPQWAKNGKIAIQGRCLCDWKQCFLIYSYLKCYLLQ